MKKQKSRKNHLPKITVDAYITERIQEKRTANQHNAADLYRTTRNWIVKYQNGNRLCFPHLTPGWVDRFILFLQSAKLKNNTINTYISNLRTLYNRAYRDRLIPRHTESPFAHIILKRGQPISRAIQEDDLHQIVSMKSTCPDLTDTINYCTFSYLACGMPFIDLAHLTTDNIQNDEIVYRRKKTSTRIRIGITEGMQKLINYYADKSSHYLFPILPKPDISHEEYKSILRAYNHSLKQLGERLPHPVRLTSYVFRHTWACEALRKHTPISIISQALGHTSEKTTRFYLSTLDQSEMNRMNHLVIGKLDHLVAQG